MRRAVYGTQESPIQEVDVPEGATPYPPEIIEEYTSKGWWQNLTYGDLLDRAAAAYPDKRAIIDARVELTYSALKNKVDRLAIALVDLCF